MDAISNIKVMSEFFDNIELEEDIISSETSISEKSFVFDIETIAWNNYTETNVSYNRDFAEKIIRRNLNALNLSEETNIRYDVVSVEPSVEPEDYDEHQIGNPNHLMPNVSVKVMGMFGNTKDIIEFLTALCFLRCLPDRRMYQQIIYYGTLSYIKFNDTQMFLTEPVNTNIHQTFGSNFNNLVFIVDNILGCNEENTKKGEVIRCLGQWPFADTCINNIITEHTALLDDYNIKLQEDVVLTIPYEEQEHEPREYIYPRFIEPDKIKNNTPIEESKLFYMQSPWNCTRTRFNATLDYKALYKLLKKPPCSVMTTLAISDTMYFKQYKLKGGFGDTKNLFWAALWKQGIVVLNGFNNPKCKFEPQPLFETMFNPVWDKLPQKFNDFINESVLKNIIVPKRLMNFFCTCWPHNSFNKDKTGCAVIYLGQYMLDGRPQEVTLGMYGTRGRIMQQIQKIFTDVELTDEEEFAITKKDD